LVSSRKLRSSSVFVIFDVFGERQGERGKEEESGEGEKKWESKCRSEKWWGREMVKKMKR
jgi:hypothetical protein